MSERRVDVFFYGLFMDIGVLRQSGVEPVNPRRASADGFALRIGRRATLVAAPGARAYGVIYSLTHAELHGLYDAPGLEQYLPEGILAMSLDGAPIPALCYNLPGAPRPEEKNPDYAARLQAVLRDLGFPPEYVAAVGGEAGCP